MEEPNAIELFNMFKSEADVFDSKVQIIAVTKLPTIAIALGEEDARTILLPYLKTYLNKIYCFDEVQLHFATILTEIFPAIGGSEHVELLFDLYDVLISSDENAVREAAVASLCKVAEKLDDDTLKGPFVEFVLMLLEKEWFPAKTAAIELFTLIYPRVPEESKNILREQYLRLYEDESPMIRRASAINLNQFSKVLEEEYIDTIALGLLLNFSSDDQDIVRSYCVDIVITLSKLLNEKQVEDHIVEIIKRLSADVSWKVRLQVADKIHDIQESIGPNSTRKHLKQILQILAADVEHVVREAIAKNVVKFCEKLQETYDGIKLDPTIENDLFPVIKRLNEDACESVKLNLAMELMEMGNILDEDRIRKHLLPLITSSIQNDASKIDECFISNLNKILMIIGYKDIEIMIQNIMFQLLSSPTTNWRSRRNLILTINVMCKLSTAENFTKSVLPFYHKLLSDHVFSIRRTTPIILPLIVKKYGMVWAKTHILNTIFYLAGHPHYLYRFIVLFCIDELVEPTLQIEVDTYLENLKEHPRTLYKIYYINELLDVVLYEDWIETICKKYDCNLDDNIRLYAEDTLDTFSREKLNVFENRVGDNDEIYLVELLVVILKYILNIVKELSNDKVDNVKFRTANTLQKIVNLKKRLEHELSLVWVQDILQGITEAEMDSIRLEVHKKVDDVEKYMAIETNHVDKGLTFNKKSYNSLEKLNDVDKSDSGRIYLEQDIDEACFIDEKTNEDETSFSNEVLNEIELTNSSGDDFDKIIESMNTIGIRQSDDLASIDV